uniref:Uncharacterized protein n=2 Tax=Hemiselmis andersenii TaxID=464988 RepID=A0A6U5CUD0_HEMAN|mmetsp:Transcript_35687/g.83571  ORF Transcript_35687/g.83571 Transcript_35687/m.83571 type:complete len:103 (+) Transcript_35687:182-490(+)
MGMGNLISEAWQKTKDQAVPSVPRGLGLLCLIFNIILPGWGTIIASVQAGDAATGLLGVVQFLSSALLVGYIFSVWWGILIFNRSKHHEAMLLGISIYSQEP